MPTRIREHDVEGFNLNGNHLEDVNLTGVSDGQLIAWDNTAGKFVAINAPADPPEELNDLSDVNLAGLADGNVLIYNSGSGQFEPGDAPQDVSALDDLSDVTLTSPSADEVLTYDGSGWVNSPPGTAPDDSMILVGHAVLGTGATTTSSSAATVGLSVAVTPQSASSEFLVVFTGNCRSTSGTPNRDRVESDYHVRADASNLGSLVRVGAIMSGWSTGDMRYWNPVTIIRQHAPATTSEVTFDVTHLTNHDGSQEILQAGATLTVYEIPSPS